MAHTSNDVTYLTCTETAKLVRQALKAAWPGVKFSVRSDSMRTATPSHAKDGDA